MNSHVRRASSDDLERLVALGSMVQDLHAEARPDIFRPTAPADLRTFFRDRLEDGSSVLVVDLAGHVIAYLLAEHQARGASPFKNAGVTLYIHHIAVDPEFRGQGVGAMLLAAAERLAQENGAASLRLDSWEFNATAHGFFSANGFEPLNIVFERRL